jgi:hypothetical protein
MGKPRPCLQGPQHNEPAHQKWERIYLMIMRYHRVTGRLWSNLMTYWVWIKQLTDILSVNLSFIFMKMCVSHDYFNTFFLQEFYFITKKMEGNQRCNKRKTVCVSPNTEYRLRIWIPKNTVFVLSHFPETTNTYCLWKVRKYSVLSQMTDPTKNLFDTQDIWPYWRKNEKNEDDFFFFFSFVNPNMRQWIFSPTKKILIPVSGPK